MRTEAPPAALRRLAWREPLAGDASERSDGALCDPGLQRFDGRMIVEDVTHHQRQSRSSSCAGHRPGVARSCGHGLLHHHVAASVEGEQTEGTLTGLLFGAPTSWEPFFDDEAGRYPNSPILGPNALDVRSTATISCTPWKR